MKRFFSVLIFLLCCFTNTFADKNTADNALWQQANNAYQQKDYETAKNLYLQLLQQQKENTEALYNLGNTYFRLDDNPNAILYYQKVLRLEPKNKQAQQNLDLAQSRIEGGIMQLKPVFFIQWWNNATSAHNVNLWALLALLFFTVIFFLAYFSSTNRLKYSGRYIAASVTFFLIFLFCAFISYQHAVHYDKAVVMQSNTILLQSPKEASKVLGNVPAGTTVSTNTRQDGFIEVELSNGRTGWVNAEALAEI